MTTCYLVPRRPAAAGLDLETAIAVAAEQARQRGMPGRFRSYFTAGGES